MAPIFWILISVLLVSLISLIGILSLLLKEKLLEKVLFALIAAAAGALLGAAFLDLIPEVLEKGGSGALSYVLIGIISFFILERFIFWHHCHDGKCDVHIFTYLNIIGDGIHNFIDGMTIAAAYLTSVPLGAVTTLAIISHEIPQEIGDFGILLYGGFSKYKAIYYNFLSALTAFAGAIIVYFFLPLTENYITFLLSFASGGFIYIASTDLIPELNKELRFSRSLLQLFFFIAGTGVIWVVMRIFD